MKTYIIKSALIILSFSLFYACLEERSTLEVPTHPNGWLDKSSEIFHGNGVFSSEFYSDNCQSCHGQNYDGGTSNVSCYEAGCHISYPHPENFAYSTTDEFHPDFIKDLNWDLSSCKTCHGDDYTGGASPNETVARQKNCTRCHDQNADPLASGPEACNTCHGSLTNPAPPKDLADNTGTTQVGVGAHQVHLTGSTWSEGYTKDCTICHTMPQTLDAAGHVGDDTPGIAEINFGVFAHTEEDLFTSWNHETKTCSNVYCHGAFEFKKENSEYPFAYTGDVMSGNNVNMIWTDVGSGQADCGTCHGLPPQGHQVQGTVTVCSGCHGRVVDENNNIINKALHINGQADVF